MPIEQKVFKVLSETLNIPADKILHESKIADLVSDSIQLFELLIRFEKELGEKVRYEDVANIERVGDIVKYATARLAGASI